MSHDTHNAHSKENKTIISFKNSFWLVIILVGLFIAALNFIQVESAHGGEGHGGGHGAATHGAADHGRHEAGSAKHEEAAHEAAAPAADAAKTEGDAAKHAEPAPAGH